MRSSPDARAILGPGHSCIGTLCSSPEHHSCTGPRRVPEFNVVSFGVERT